MSETSQGGGWWVASDGNWYPPELHPSRRVLRPPVSTGLSTWEAHGGPSARAPTAAEPWHAHRDQHFAKHSLRLAGVGTRAMAWFLDAVITGFVAWGLIVLSLGVVRDAVLGVVLVLGFSFWYHVWRIGVTKGQTPGMALFRIGVAEASTGKYPIGLRRAIVRAAAAVLFACIPFAIFVDRLWACVDAHRQTLHDKIASTVVATREA